MKKILVPIIILFILGLLAYGISEIFSIVNPENYKLNLSAGAKKGIRHNIAEILQAESKLHNVDIELIETQGSLDMLEKIKNRKLDLGLIQGGVKSDSDSELTQLAGLTIEPLHLAVKDKITATQLTELKGRNLRLNLSTKKSGTYQLSSQLLTFIKFDGYKEMNLSYEEIFNLMDKPSIEELPDAVFSVSTLPSPVIKRLIEEKNFRLMALPYGKALSINDIWVNETKIAPYVYGMKQDKEVMTIGTRLLLVSHKRIDSDVVGRLLNTIYSQSFIQSSKMPLVEISNPEIMPQYSLHPGVAEYKSQNDPLFTKQLFLKIKGLTFPILSILICIILSFYIYYDNRKKSFSIYFNEAKTNELSFEELIDNYSDLNEEQKLSTILKIKDIVKQIKEIRRKAMEKYLTHAIMNSLQVYIADLLGRIDRFISDQEAKIK